MSAYSAKRHPEIKVHSHDGYISVGEFFEVTPVSARALAAALIVAAGQQETRMGFVYTK